MSCKTCNDLKYRQPPHSDVCPDCKDLQPIISSDKESFEISEDQSIGSCDTIEVRKLEKDLIELKVKLKIITGDRDNWRLSHRELKQQITDIKDLVETCLSEDPKDEALLQIIKIIQDDQK